nr:sugar-binding domain-containing protein [Microbacterium immunditiarum]
MHEGWSVRAASGPAPADIAAAVVPASVPGVVHTDLLAAGLIPDPFLDDNEALLAWIGLVDWTYETTVQLSREELAAAHHHLVFEGIDTVATVSLNGSPLGEVANQHRTFRFDVTELVREGANTLTVAFRSPVRYANAQGVALGARPRPYPLPYDAIRKAACSFGWDWGISTATSGIWRPVRVESWSVARLTDVRVHAVPNEGGGGRVDAVVRVERETAAALTVSLAVAGGEASVTIPAGETEATVTVEVDAVERWWPAGHGAQPLYDAVVSLSADGEETDAATRRVGFRDLRWETAPDADGTPFQLVVNDRPVFVKGVNWIPDDAFFTRVDRARYARRLGQAKAANVNLVRVWGGGVYESDDFFDVCDELGLLTWQDFTFACAAYAEEDPLRSEVEAEARDNIVRLAHHASLAVLCGNNECLWGYEDWGWQALLDGRTWGAYYYRDLLPALIAELAPHVPYIPGSPFSPGDRHPNDERHGATHLWEQWNRRDWITYREHTPRFVAEFGWQGPPTWTTLTRAVGDDPLTPDSPGMIVHQKAAEGGMKLAAGLVPHYRVPDDIETWHWATQLNQANAVSAGLEWFRSHAPGTSGAIVWQLNDCWPVTSWAAIDGDGREKPLFFALARAFAPRLVTVQPRGDALAVTLVNDTDDQWHDDLVLTRRPFDGAVLAEHTVPVSLAPRSVVTLPVPEALAHATDAAAEVLVATAGAERGLWYFAEPRDSALTAAQLEFSVARDGGEFIVGVTSRGLVRDLTLLVDRLSPDATIDRGLVTLLPGESTEFRVSGMEDLDADAVADPLVARSANQLVTR